MHEINTVSFVTSTNHNYSSFSPMQFGVAIISLSKRRIVFHGSFVEARFSIKRLWRISQGVWEINCRVNARRNWFQWNISGISDLLVYKHLDIQALFEMHNNWYSTFGNDFSWLSVSHDWLIWYVSILYIPSGFPYVDKPVENGFKCTGCDLMSG